MNTWLTTQIGAEAANIVSYVALFIAAIIVLWLIILIVKRLSKGTYVVGGKNREPRLSVRDAAPIDSKRQLVLIKRDNVEHLILIGGPTDIVIERNISNTSPEIITAPEMFNGTDVASAQSDNSQEVPSAFPTPHLSPISSATVAVHSVEDIEENFPPKDINTAKNTHESQLESHEFAHQNQRTISQTEHNDLTPSQLKNNENDQTIFANLASNKDKKSKVLNTVPPARTMNDESFQSVSFENVTLSSEETQPLMGDERKQSESDFTAEDTSNYITPNQDERHANTNSSNGNAEAYQQIIIHDDETTDSGLHSMETEGLGDSAPIEAQPPNDLSSQEELPVVNFDENESSHLPIDSKSTKGNQKLGNTAHLAVAETNFRRDSNKKDPLNSKARETSISQAKISSSARNDTTGSVKLSALNNIPSPEQNDHRDGISGDLVNTNQTSKQQATPPDQNNPFGTPKPINPYKVMKASGAFRASNNSVNFGTQLANAPLKKGNVDANKSVSIVTSGEDIIRQESASFSKATPSKVGTLDSPNKTNVLTNIKKPTYKASVNTSDESSSLTNSLQTKEQIAADVSSTKEQVTSSLDLQNSLTGAKPINQKESNSATRIVASNVDNKSFNDSERLKSASSTNNTQATQERPVMQRSVPQGMLRPPLMAKPRNAATAISNIQSVRSVSTEKNEQNSSSATVPSDKANTNLKNDTKAVQSVTTTKETVADAGTITNITEVNEAAQLVGTETAHKTPNSSSQVTKPTAQSKISNLQKFSLQLLEPQHILDKPNRSDENNEDDNMPVGKQLKSREEEEFDKRLQSELNQSDQK